MTMSPNRAKQSTVDCRGGADEADGTVAVSVFKRQRNGDSFGSLQAYCSSASLKVARSMAESTATLVEIGRAEDNVN